MDSPLVFVNGLGQNRHVWDRVITALPDSVHAFAVDVHLGAHFTLNDAASRVHDELDERGIERAHLCGLSLGAMIAIPFAATHPTRVDRLILSGAQIHPNRALMRIQRAILSALPARAVAYPGVEKKDVLATLDAIYGMDLRPQLPPVSAPTLVMCGSRDVVNRAPAREIAAAIPDASLQIVPGVGHEWNASHPELFADHVMSFLTSATPQS